MRTSLSLFASALLVCVSVYAQFTNGQAADVVLGQPNMTTGTSPGSPSSTAMTPQSVAIDVANGKIYVADATFDRVLRWSSSAVSASAAEAVFGQVDFVTLPSPSVTQTSMHYPIGVLVDGFARLWVVDNLPNRVLRFNSAYNIVSGSSSANVVLGEPDFTTGGGGSDQFTMSSPYAAAIDAAGRLYVADQNNNRVLRFDDVASKSNGAGANGVLGQPDLSTIGAATTSQKMSAPTGVAIDNTGTLYVADQGNNRVLIFTNAASKANGAAADGVLGQVNLTLGGSGHSASTMSSPFGVAIDGARRLYVSDQGNNRILIYTSQTSITNNIADLVLGQTSLTVPSPDAATTATGLSGPAGMVVDNTAGKLWVADANNYRVLRYSSSTVPLPVEFASFTAKTRNAKVELAWATAGEINNYGFDVERKTINNEQSTINNWEKIGFVEGHGTTNAPQVYSFTDAAARVGKYSYRLKQIDRDGKYEYHQAVEVALGITPNTVWLDNNYPNPFNPSTRISFVLGTTGNASLKIFDLLGKEVVTLADGVFTAGEVQTFTFDASQYSSGMYYYQLKSGAQTEMKKMLLLK